MSLRQQVKQVVEQGLLASGLPRFSRWRRGGDVLILAYHNIVPKGSSAVGDRSLHLQQDAFAKQLDYLVSAHDVIPLAEALTQGARSPGRVSVVVTFDDAYRGAVTAGVAELAARSLPATIFVPPAFLNGGMFWWDALSPLDSDEGLLPELRAIALSELKGKGDFILAHALPGAISTMPDHARGATEDELHRAAAIPGITLGSHTWSHPNLAELDEEELEEELQRPLAWLGERFPTVVPYITYPYGLSSPVVEQAAARAGYRGALRVDGGWLPKALESHYSIPRINIPAGLSLAGFQLRCAGVLT